MRSEDQAELLAGIRTDAAHAFCPADQERMVDYTMEALKKLDDVWLDTLAAVAAKYRRLADSNAGARAGLLIAAKALELIIEDER